MTKSDEAEAASRSRFTCSSTVFSAFSEELGLEPDTGKKNASGFGAGIAKTGNICGAVSGAIMVIGLKYGKTQKDDEAAIEKTQALVREFIHEFTKNNGSINCTEPLGYDMRDPAAYAAARDSGVFMTKCPALVRDAADIVERVL